MPDSLSQLQRFSQSVVLLMVIHHTKNSLNKHLKVSKPDLHHGEQIINFILKFYAFHHNSRRTSQSRESVMSVTHLCTSDDQSGEQEAPPLSSTHLCKHPDTSAKKFETISLSGSPLMGHRTLTFPNTVHAFSNA
jgi:hypothetical protein